MVKKREKSLPLSSRSLLLSIGEELWQVAEERAQEILWTIEPNTLSEMNRKNIIDYVQKLIRSYFGPELRFFPFGSVPLKTYLPDGDIDLTILSYEDAEEDLAKEISCILGSGNDPEYEIEAQQHIPAQVQVVKCTVKKIPVDITFNQMAGIYTLRFLEQVDKLVEKKHLFKRCIILIKAWCYYEGRILGAYHGLLSTYAVETMVLYIINRFHSSVHGPLEVLYIFMKYYGSFDWDHNYMSIWGPRAISSLPEIVEIPECERGEFLLQKEFLKNYRDMTSFSAKAFETSAPKFPVKHMNIMDPLRDDNNLGRSVNSSNYRRITFALSCGARKLKWILKFPGQDIGELLEKFFSTTLNRNGRGERADANAPVAPFGTGRAQESVLCGDCDSYYGALQFVHPHRNYAMPETVHSSYPLSPSQVDINALSMQQNWSEGDVVALATRQYWSEGDHLALSTQQNRSQDGVLGLSAQQNWNMYQQSRAEAYIPGQSLYHPTYTLEGGKSRGTGTYIPDLKYNNYWDLRAKAVTPRTYPYENYIASPRSPLRKQQAEEARSETEMNANSKPFELSHEDFPDLPGICKAITPPQAQECAPLAMVHSETNNDSEWKLSEISNEDFPFLPKIHSVTNSEGNSRSFELSNEDFPFLPKVHSVINSEGNSKPFELSNEDFPFLPKVHSVTNSEGNSKPFELSNEDFPFLPKVHSVTNSEGNSKPFELSNEDFPFLPKVHSVTNSEGNSKPFELSNEDFPFLRKVHSVTNSEGNSKPFELSNEDFPFLPKVHAGTNWEGDSKSFELTNEDFPFPPKVHAGTNLEGDSKSIELINDDFPFLPKVHAGTNLEGDSKSFELTIEDFPFLPNVHSVTNLEGNSKSFELTNEDFPRLQSTHKTIKESSQLTKEAKGSPSSEVEEKEFGSYNISQALTELSLSTKEEEEASGVSLSEETVLAVQKVTMEGNEESPESNEKMD